MFETLAEEDYAFMPDRKLDEEFPKFGISTSDYDEVISWFFLLIYLYFTRIIYFGMIGITLPHL